MRNSMKYLQVRWDQRPFSITIPLCIYHLAVRIADQSFWEFFFLNQKSSDNSAFSFFNSRNKRTVMTCHHLLSLSHCVTLNGFNIFWNFKYLPSAYNMGLKWFGSLLKVSSFNRLTLKWLDLSTRQSSTQYYWRRHYLDAIWHYLEVRV